MLHGWSSGLACRCFGWEAKGCEVKTAECPVDDVVDLLRQLQGGACFEHGCLHHTVRYHGCLRVARKELLLGEGDEVGHGQSEHGITRMLRDRCREQRLEAVGDLKEHELTGFNTGHEDGVGFVVVDGVTDYLSHLRGWLDCLWCWDSCGTTFGGGFTGEHQVVGIAGYVRITTVEVDLEAVGVLKRTAWVRDADDSATLAVLGTNGRIVDTDDVTDYWIGLRHVVNSCAAVPDSMILILF